MQHQLYQSFDIKSKAIYRQHQQVIIYSYKQISISKSQMEATIHTSSYDVIVIRHKNNTLKSTAFQAVFAQKNIKKDPKKIKLKDLQFFVNDVVVDIPIRIDPSNGRVQFQKKYIRKGNISDSSDISDDQRSHSKSREKLISNPIKSQPLDAFKNQQASFWQFAWLFNKKPEANQKMAKPLQEESKDEQTKLACIKQQFYEGQLGSKEPLFQLSLCGSLLGKKNTGKQELQKIFYANKIEYKDFIKDPLSIINDPNLIVRIDNSLYTWQLGAIVLACKFAYGEQYQKLVDEVIQAKNKKSWFSFSRDNVTKLDIDTEPPSIQTNVKFDQQEIIKYKKTPDSQMLDRMKLKLGQNQAKFVLQISPGVFEQTEFQIFLWDENEKVIVSDIDGTITRSDVMGQVKTNYIHKGVCLLYNQIYKRNYKILYMTARAIGQYGQTKKFLKKQVQENNMKLPPGPILMNPDGYYKSFKREMIQKNPDQLKIKLLASVNQIFPSTKKPIIAGFGNRQTDSIAYLRIQIPPNRIFCITQKSVITNQSDKDFQTNYIQMLDKIDQYFPNLPKYEGSQESLSKSNGKEQVFTDQNEEEILKNHRKMSHNEFYERSPNSKRNSVVSISSKAFSQENNPNEQDVDLQLIIQQYMTKSQQQKKKE